MIKKVDEIELRIEYDSQEKDGLTMTERVAPNKN